MEKSSNRDRLQLRTYCSSWWLPWCTCKITSAELTNISPNARSPMVSTKHSILPSFCKTSSKYSHKGVRSQGLRNCNTPHIWKSRILLGREVGWWFQSLLCSTQILKCQQNTKSMSLFLRVTFVGLREVAIPLPICIQLQDKGAQFESVQWTVKQMKCRLSVWCFWSVDKVAVLKPQSQGDPEGV